MKNRIIILSLCASCLLAIVAFVYNSETKTDPLALSPIVAKRVTTPTGTLVSCNLKALKDTVDIPLSYLTEELQVVKLDNRDEALVGGWIRTTVGEKYILVNALAGNVPGILAMQTSGKPGSVSEFWIRGISTFGASNSALVLVDGFERSLDEINVEDVESFSVLKDASATAIYGSKGANGVVLITTKHGKAGKINISAKAETFYNMLTQVPDFVDGYTYASMANEAKITRNLEPLYKADELEIFRLGLDPDLYPNVNWIDELLRKGSWSTRATLSMNGGGNTARY